MGNTLNARQRAKRKELNDQLLKTGQYQCSRCQKIKPIAEFSPYGKRLDKPYSQCRECTNERINRRNRERALKRRQDYTRHCQLCDKPMEAGRNTERFCCKAHRLFVWQVGQYHGNLDKARELFKTDACEACGSPDKLCIDHSHLTHRVRGRLCTTCNSALGHFFESITSMENAIGYLTREMTIPNLPRLEDKGHCRWCKIDLVDPHPNRRFCSVACKHRATDVKQKYGLTVEQYDWLLLHQNGTCPICKQALETPIVDHRHDTSEVRGLLCWHCNLALGHIQDDAMVITGLIKYLESHTLTREDWSVRPIDNKLTRQIAKERHYLHRNPNVSYGFGLYDKNELVGICSFGSPSSMRITNSVCPDDPKSVIELNRLWIDDKCPKFTASWFVSRCLKLLPSYIVISYADTGVVDEFHGRNHDGTIYRALNFHYSGQSKASMDWRLPGRTRNVGPKVEGAIPIPVPPKNRYWTVTGNRQDKRRLRSICRWQVLEFPKKKDPA